MDGIDHPAVSLGNVDILLIFARGRRLKEAQTEAGNHFYLGQGREVLEFQGMLAENGAVALRNDIPPAAVRVSDIGQPDISDHGRHPAHEDEHRRGFPHLAHPQLLQGNHELKFHQCKYENVFTVHFVQYVSFPNNIHETFFLRHRSIERLGDECESKKQKAPSPPFQRYYDRAKAAHRHQDSVLSVDSSEEESERRTPASNPKYDLVLFNKLA